MLKWLFPTKRPYIDEHKVRVKKEAEFAVEDIVEYGSEEDLLAQAKIWNPNLTAKDLEKISTLYRVAKRERGK